MNFISKNLGYRRRKASDNTPWTRRKIKNNCRGDIYHAKIYKTEAQRLYSAISYSKSKQNYDAL